MILSTSLDSEIITTEDAQETFARQLLQDGAHPLRIARRADAETKQLGGAHCTQWKAELAYARFRTPVASGCLKPGLQGPVLKA